MYQKKARWLRTFVCVVLLCLPFRHVAGIGWKVTRQVFDEEIQNDSRVWLLHFFKAGEDNTCAACDAFQSTWQKLSAGLTRFMLGRVVVNAEDGGGSASIAKACGVDESALPVLLMIDSKDPDAKTQNCATSAYQLMTVPGHNAKQVMGKDALRDALLTRVKSHGLLQGDDGVFARKVEHGNSASKELFGDPTHGTASEVKANEILFIVRSQPTPLDNVLSKEIRDSLVSSGVPVNHVELLHEWLKRNPQRNPESGLPFDTKVGLSSHS